MIIIYALGDPRTKRVRYVGKTVHLKRRIANHLTPYRLNGTTHRANWLRSLVNAGLKPDVIILEELPDDADWASAENKWITYYREQGEDLTNFTDGGDGGATHYGHKPSAASVDALKRHSESQRGKPGTPLTEEQKQFLSEKAKERWKKWKEEGYQPLKGHTEETKKQIGEKNKGRKPSAEAIRKTSELRKGKKQSEEANKKRSETLKKTFSTWSEEKRKAHAQKVVKTRTENRAKKKSPQQPSLFDWFSDLFTPKGKKGKK